MRSKPWSEIVRSAIRHRDDHGIHYYVPDIGPVYISMMDVIEAKRLGGNPLCCFCLPDADANCEPPHASDSHRIWIFRQHQAAEEAP